METKPLRQRAINSAGWVFGGHLFSQLTRLASNLIMTRLLVPEMFGVMALVAVFMMGIAMFSDLGLLQNVVQSKRGEDRDYLNTAWSIQILRGAGIFLICILASIAIFSAGQAGILPENSAYSNAELPFLLALMSTTALIAGFNSINILVLNRKLMIARVTLMDISSQVIGLLVMIAIALYWREIWVLVISGIVSALLKLVLSHHRSFGERPRLMWERDCVSEIVNFGKWIFISSILGFLLGHGDRLLLGAWISAEQLGFYTIAAFMATALKAILQNMSTAVFYPVLSEVVRDQPERLKTLYYELRFKIDILTMSVAGLFAGGGHLLIEFLYDDRYRAVGWMFEILSVSIVFVGYGLAGACLMARGSSKSHAILLAIAALFLYTGLPIAFHFYGLVGAIVFIAVYHIVDIPSTFYMMRKAGLLDVWREFRILPLLPLAYLAGSQLSAWFS